jgi:alpha-tubulin suppressor-like RCC1 family protein
MVDGIIETMPYGIWLSSVLLVLALGCAHKPDEGSDEVTFDGGSHDGDADDGFIDVSAPAKACDEPQPADPACESGDDAGAPVSIVSGASHTCALFSGGTVKCWGDNSEGQLGIGVSCAGASAVPLPVANLCGVKALSAGELNTCALLENGTVKCWGTDTPGIADTTTPTTLDAAAAVACPVLANVGTERMFGTTPGIVRCLKDVVAIAAGVGVDCAVIADGTVRCWGEVLGGGLGNGSGLSVLPDPTPNFVVTPVTVSNIHSATGIAVQGNTGCALLSDTTVECWGQNESGELGDGTTDPSAFPVHVRDLKGAAAVTASATISLAFGYSCARLADGTVGCWGEDQDDELGDGQTTLSATTAPKVVSGVHDVASLVGGEGHVFAVLTNGTVTAWGANTCGELGTGTVNGADPPVHVQMLDHVTAVSAGNCFACALRADGGVECLGDNTSGQLGNATDQTPESLTPVQVLW